MSDVLAAAAALHLAFSIAVQCQAPPGTVVAAIRVAGGNGNPVTMQPTGGDQADFAIRGATVVVAAGGISPAHCGSARALTVTATQSGDGQNGQH